MSSSVVPSEKIISCSTAIIGSGPAGYTAALYLARYERHPFLFRGLQVGGQLTTTTDVENYPGFPGGIQGPDLMEKFAQQAQEYGTTFIDDTVVEVDFSQRPFILKTSQHCYKTPVVIIATGAKAKYLDIPGEDHFLGYGVSTCATCDGRFFKGKKVAVVGGGNSALEEALFLSNYVEKVFLIHRRDTFRGEKILQQRVMEKKNIDLLFNHVALEVLGHHDPKKVTHLKVKNLVTQEEYNLDVEGFFVAIGHTPNTDIFRPYLKTDDQGYLRGLNEEHRDIPLIGPETEIPGVFMAGDVYDHYYRQAITAAGQGCMAAIAAEKWLQQKGS